MRLYFAGPLFTWGEREQNRQIVDVLRLMGHEVFLPQESEQKAPVTDAGIFAVDIGGIAWAEAIVGCMDGPDPDSGTCFEVGKCHGVKPIIVYHTDIRQETPFGPYNLMLHQAANAVLNCEWMSPPEIANKIDLALKAL